MMAWIRLYSDPPSSVFVALTQTLTSPLLHQKQ